MLPSLEAMPSRFLSAMLQRIESEIGELRRFFAAENAEDAALVVKVIVESRWKREFIDLRYEACRCLFQRRGPNVAKCRHCGASVNHSIYFDAEIAPRDFTNASRPDTCILPQFPSRGQVKWASR